MIQSVYNTVLYAALSSYPQFIANNKNVWYIIFFIPYKKSSDLLFTEQAALTKISKTKYIIVNLEKLSRLDYHYYTIKAQGRPERKKICFV
jgi:hypothetical protein